MSTHTVEIKRVSRLNRGNFIAFFSVTIDDLIVINDCRLVNSTNGYFVGFPQRKYTDKEGNEKYMKTVYILSDDLKNQIEEAAIEKCLAPPSNNNPLPHEDEEDIPF